MRTKKTTTPTTLVGLSQAALRHLVKPRPDFDRFATDLLALYEAHLDVLGDAGIDVAAVKAALAEYNALRTSEMTAKAQYDLVRETRLERSSTVWVAMLEIYARATAASRTSPIIQRGIAAFAAFMKNGPRKKAAAAPATA